MGKEKKEEGRKKRAVRSPEQARGSGNWPVQLKTDDTSSSQPFHSRLPYLYSVYSHSSLGLFQSFRAIDLFLQFPPPFAPRAASSQLNLIANAIERSSAPTTLLYTHLVIPLAPPPQ